MPLFLLLIFSLTLSEYGFAQKSRSTTTDDYKTPYFGADAPWKTLWVDKGQRENIEAIVGHRFIPFRIRYWGEGHRTGWVFEEIGKELPITVGVIVEDGRIVNLTVLEFRESRGGDVVYPFFTGQFTEAELKRGNTYALDKTIDGITGATLSVRALKKVAILALYCHQQAGL